MCRELVCCVSFVLLLGLASSASAEIPTDPNLVIYYSFDSVGAIVPDESGRGHHGTVCGDVSLVPSGIKWYGAAEFEGIWGPTGYSYLDLDSPHYPAEDIPKSAITLAAWCKCQDTGQHHALMSTRASDNTWVMHPQVNSNGTFRWLLRTYGGTTIFNLNNVGSHGWDEWLHYAGTYDSTIGKGILYINGEVCADIDVAEGQVIADWGTGARVGYNIDNARPFTGIMDEFYLFTRPLTQSEINVLLDAEGLPSEKATHPNPADGTELEVTAMNLEWALGTYAVSSDVYFGENFADVNDGTGNTFQGNVTEPQFMVTDLEGGKTYYWRIDGVNPDDPNSPWKGDVWSFLILPATAWNPNPSDGAIWVDPNASLSWNPGSRAMIHYVYFGDDFNTVSTATDGAPQTDTTYDPPAPLEFEKEYYWRVDEFDTTGATHTGDVWRFTTMRSDSGLKGEYYEGDFEASILTRTDPGINFDWEAGTPDPEVPADGFSVRWTGELEVPFTADWTFTASCDDWVRLWVNDRLLFDKWEEQGGVEWVETVKLGAGQRYSIQLEYYERTGNARAMLYWNSPPSLTPYQPKQIIPQGAFSLPLRARSPYPAIEGPNIPQTPILQWAPGDMAASHDVYFGEDPNVVADANTTTTGIYRGRQALDATTFDPGALEWGKTYYWRVDEVNDAEADSPWTGSVWSFTTADFIIVDDFEAYTNDSPHRVFQTWVDGLGYSADDYFPDGHPGNGTGAAGGHDIWGVDSPYFEGSIMEIDDVHGGKQAMPLYYNNTATPYYSEVERTWAAAQDWTINDVNTLTLYVRGDADNDTAPLYVVLTDSAGHTGTASHPDAEIATAPEWTVWQIPLSDFTASGVTVTAVNTMAIGVGSRNATTPGGSGVIYIDDIGVK